MSSDGLGSRPGHDPGDLSGQTLGHHHVLECVGAGGMGVVYRARDARLERPVALKVMRPARLADPRLRRRFLREARAASRLNHPGIVTIYEADSLAGLDYIAMEFVEGPSLAALIPAGGLPPETALRYGRQLAEALAAAHEAGIVHRDLKPANVLVAPGDRLKIADFGLARIAEPAAGDPAAAETRELLTASGAILGTASYMSPEQAAGAPADARSDLFSLGCILHEMLAGNRAFDGPSPAAVMAAIMRDVPAPPAKAPTAVRALVERCLRKRPQDRFQSAAEVVAAIDACLRAGGAGEPGGRRSLAVLPFANLSGAREDDYLCEGLTEEIINVLTSLPGLAVIARTSAFAVARLGLDACEIGARLGVETIMEGSVRRRGSRVRVTAQLIETGRGAHLWSERYERELTDIFALEDEIAGAILERLRGDLEPRPARAQRSVAPEVLEAYHEGRYHFARGSAEALARAGACYARALALAPDFAPAHESLAELHFFAGFYGTVPPREAFGVSAWHAARAIELDDGLAEAHAMLANLRKELDYDWAEVRREFGIALALNPTSPVVRLRRAISELMPPGRLEEAAQELELVLASDPLSVWVRFWVGVIAMLARQPERILAEGRRMIELDAAHPLGHVVLGFGELARERLPEAAAALEKGYALSGGLALPAAWLSYAYGRLGRAEEVGALSRKPGGAGTYVAPMVAASGLIGLGEWDEAFVWLDRAVEMRDPLIVPIKNLPLLDPLRGDPRFAELLRKMKLAP